jgi:RNA polymerase sigma-70 factor, ECF subfamily
MEPTALMTPDEIDALASRAAKGDRAAFRALVLELEGDLRFHLVALEVSEGLADEVLQATFVSAFEKLAQYRGAGAFRAWLKVIARNHLLRALRDQQRFAALGGDALEGALVARGLEDLERMEELERQSRRLRACIERLPEALRTLVEGRYVEGLSSKRLAERFTRTEIWVRVTLCRTRSALRRCMEKQEA